MGDMGELGDNAAGLHREIGAEAKAAGIDQLYAFGEMSREAVAAFGSGARHFDSVDALSETLCGELAAGTTVLVKGSRFMRMERVVERLTQGESATCC